MSTTDLLSLQERYGAHSSCFGCGPANPQGLRIRSRVEGEVVAADWTPAEHHRAFPGVLNGGIIGTGPSEKPRWKRGLWCQIPRRQEGPAPS